MLVQLLLPLLALLVCADARAFRIKQTTRQEIIQRATRARTAKRADTSPIPILCGTGQQFKLQYSGIVTDTYAQNGKLAELRQQRNNAGTVLASASREIAGTADPAVLGSGQAFTLDGTCNLVAVGGLYDGYVMNASEGPTVTSTKLYFDTPGIINSPWVATKCSVSGGTHQLSCTSGPKAVLETCDIVAPRGATYIATTPPNNCQPLTMTAIPFTPTP